MSKTVRETVAAWLEAFKQLHPRSIDLGLERSRAVALKLKLLAPNCPLISVAGTNGKGSSVGYLESIYRAAGYRCGCYTTPHLLHYRERIRIDGNAVEDPSLCAAFETIYHSKGTLSLTEFEFGTLAAMLLFQQAQVEVILLEVGLGGRLDAVNVWDADCALITAIGLDHCEYLGNTREQIALEKAGIMRPHRPAVCSDPLPPPSLLAYAKQQQVPLACLSRQHHQESSTSAGYYYKKHEKSWCWGNQQAHYANLDRLQPDTDYAYQNAAGVLQVIDVMQPRLPVASNAVNTGLQNMQLQGRFQTFEELPVPCILDVAHNPLGAQALCQALQQQPCAGKTHALLGMMRDKDIVACVSALSAVFDVWHLVDLPLERAATASDLQAYLWALGIQTSDTYTSVEAAYNALSRDWQTSDRLVVFGSFHTVAALLNISQQKT